MWTRLDFQDQPVIECRIMPEPSARVPHNRSARLRKLVLAYRRHRRIVNDNLGLIIALIAAAFAGWSGFEAHEARVDAGEIGRKTLQAQIQSVEAQTEATQLDERPYVRVDFDHAETGPNGNYATVKITSFGRTPARDIHFRVSCTQSEPDLKRLNEGPELSLDVLFPQQVLVPKLFLCEKEARHHGLGGSIFGLLTYKDPFEKSHSTRFCYTFGGRKDWDWCDNLNNKAT